MITGDSGGSQVPSPPVPCSSASPPSKPITAGKDNDGRVFVLLPTWRGADLTVKAGFGGGGDPMVAGYSRPSSKPPISSIGCSGLRRRLVSSFILSVLLGLMFGLLSATNEVEVKVSCVVMRNEVVGIPRRQHRHSLPSVG
jgi:hypothetical protein